MPKINHNGIVRDMTPEELADYERMQQEMPAPEPSIEDQLRERIAALEAALLDI